MDQISNMIIGIKNAGNAGRDSVVLSYSKIKENIAEVLKKEGFIKSVEKKTVGGKPSLVVNLIMENRIPKVKGVARISKSSKRVYKKDSFGEEWLWCSRPIYSKRNTQWTRRSQRKSWWGNFIHNLVAII
jgi:hypothetical protein